MQKYLSPDLFLSLFHLLSSSLPLQGRKWMQMISCPKVFFLSPLKIELSLVSFYLLNSSLWIHFRPNLLYTKTPLHILLLSLSFCTLTVHIAIFDGILFAAALTLRKFIKWPKRQPDRVLLIYIQIEKNVSFVRMFTHRSPWQQKNHILSRRSCSLAALRTGTLTGSGSGAPVERSC